MSAAHPRQYSKQIDGCHGGNHHGYRCHGKSSPMLAMTAVHHLHTTPNGACYTSTNGRGIGRSHGPCNQQYVDHTQNNQRHHISCRGLIVDASMPERTSGPEKMCFGASVGSSCKECAKIQGPWPRYLP